MRVEVLLLFLILFVGCTKPPPKLGKKDLSGNWVAASAQYINKDESTSGVASLGKFAAERYGYATLSFQEQNRFESTIHIVKDVVVTQMIVGTEITKTAIKAPLTLTRIGKYTATDSLIIFFDVEQNKIAEGRYYFEDEKLNCNFQDEKGIWFTVWELKK
jgi:hypothetical protein